MREAAHLCKLASGSFPFKQVEGAAALASKDPLGFLTEKGALAAAQPSDAFDASDQRLRDLILSGKVLELDSRDSSSSYFLNDLWNIRAVDNTLKAFWDSYGQPKSVSDLSLGLSAFSVKPTIPFSSNVLLVGVFYNMLDNDGRQKEAKGLTKNNAHQVHECSHAEFIQQLLE